MTAPVRATEPQGGGHRGRCARGTVTFAVPFDGERGAARELTVTLSPNSWDPLSSTYIVGTPASATAPVRNRDPLLRVANATVREGPQAQLQFDVSLDRAAAEPVTVDYATADGTATAGADYTATSSTLSFAAGETQKTITVAVLDDAHDEGTETLTLTLSNARGAAIGDATATGWIVNTDPMPAAWLARFGRTSATQVLGLLDARFDEARAPASQLTLGGRPVNLSGLRGASRAGHPSAGPAPAHTRAPGRWAHCGIPAHPARRLTGQGRPGRRRPATRPPTHSMSWRPGTPWTTARAARRRATPIHPLSRTRPLGGLRHPRSPCAAAHRVGQTRALNRRRRTPIHSMSWRPGTPWTTPRGALLI